MKLFTCTYIMSAAEAIEPSALRLRDQRLADALSATAINVVIIILFS